MHLSIQSFAFGEKFFLSSFHLYIYITTWAVIYTFMVLTAEMQNAMRLRRPSSILAVGITVLLKSLVKNHLVGLKMILNYFNILKKKRKIQYLLSSLIVLSAKSCFVNLKWFDINVLWVTIWQCGSKQLNYSNMVSRLCCPFIKIVQMIWTQLKSRLGYGVTFYYVQREIY